MMAIMKVMRCIREPAVAGSFYPSDPDELRALVATMLEEAGPQPGPVPRALIVPHAGYVYSGRVRLLPHKESYQRVVLMGPAHRVALHGLALPGVEMYRSPLGLVPLDRAAYSQLDHPEVSVSFRAHRLEHGLEVQLPFLQAVLGSFSLVPLAVGVTHPDTVATVIDRLWSRRGTLVIVSSDLSHDLEYGEAIERDRCTCQAIEALDARGIRHADACGCEAVKGLLVAARRRGLVATTLNICNSGDTAGTRNHVVGYGAWMFHGNPACEDAA